MTNFYANKIQLEILSSESKEYKCGIFISSLYISEVMSIQTSYQNIKTTKTKFLI